MARFKAAVLSLIALMVLFGPAPAWAEFGQRYALVIGNSDYANVEPLPNTARDAEAMAEALESLRFTVFKGIDLNGAQFERLIDEFDAAAAKADTVVFYYAGHGFQLNGLNHLVPVDAVLRDRARIDEETFVLDDIIARIHRRQRQTIVFLDACRNNPLPPSARNGVASGLAQVGTGDGTFIAFATQPGNVSYDGTSKNSPFTEALLTHIGKPNRSISSLMIEVRNDVSDRTVGRQVPWDQSSLRADFFFNPTPEYIATAEPSQGGIVIGRPGGSAIRGGGDAAETGLETAPRPRPRPAPPISIGPAPVQAPVATKPARAQPDTVTAAATPRARPDTAKAAASLRAQPETAIATAPVADRAQSDTAAAAATAPAPPNTVTAAANFAPIERLKPEREWFPDDVAPPSPEAAEANAGERQMAALEPRQPLVSEPEIRAREPLVDPKELARSIQSDLARVGCYRLSVDGDWGPGSRSGLERYYLEKGEAPPSLEPSTDVLAMLQEESGTVCERPKASPKKPRVAAPAAPRKAPVARGAQKERPTAVAPPPRPPAAATKSPKIIGF